jgi:hemoglobin-like flavoprotein
MAVSQEESPSLPRKRQSFKTEDGEDVNGDMTEQGRKLMQMLNTVVQKLDQLNELLPQVRNLAQRHVQYGVKGSDYETVGAAFLWTLKTGLGDGFTPDVSAAWNTAAYTALSDAMRRNANDPIPREKLP